MYRLRENSEKSTAKLGFAGVVMRPTLILVASEDHERGNRLLGKAEQGCLIARSRTSPVTVEAPVQSVDEVLARGSVIGNTSRICDLRAPCDRRNIRIYFPSKGVSSNTYSMEGVAGTPK
jgi:hypothetical protein